MIQINEWWLTSREWCLLTSRLIGYKCSIGGIPTRQNGEFFCRIHVLVAKGGQVREEGVIRAVIMAFEDYSCFFCAQTAPLPY